MLVLPLIIAVLAWYLVICIKWKKTIFDIIEKIPGPKWYPFVGTFFPFQGVSREDIFYKFGEITGKYAPFYRSWNGDVPEVHLMKADHLQIVMRSSKHTTKGPFYKNLFPWLGEGVFISEGAKWFLQRKLLTPTFHFKILEGFLSSFSERSLSLVKKLECRTDGKFFDILPDVSVCTLQVIFDTAMGVPIEEVTDDPMEHVGNVNEITELVMWRYWRPYIKDMLFYLHPQGRRYNTDGYTGKKRSSFLDLVLEAKDNAGLVSDSDLKGLMNTFLLAGYETTALTLGWALFLLGNSPDIQEKAYEEIKTVLKGKKVPTTMEELQELKYLDCVIRETLRLFPVLPLITRELTEDIQIEKYTVPAGTQAVLHLFGVQRDPEHFPDPNKFDPERFLPENSKGRHPFAYIPFSAGPRICLGIRFSHLELRTALAALINSYKFKAMNTPEDIRFFAHVLIRSQNGINVKLEKREEVIVKT
ncbi:hypothetical protein Trydic_g1452 [Trypoxylus dichotomus]